MDEFFNKEYCNSAVGSLNWVPEQNGLQRNFWNRMETGKMFKTSNYTEVARVWKSNLSNIIKAKVFAMDNGCMNNCKSYTQKVPTQQILMKLYSNAAMQCSLYITIT